MGTLIVLGALALFVFIFALSGFKIVQQAEVMVIERLGKYSRTLHSGINIIWPIIDKPRNITWRYVVEGMDDRKHIRFKQKSKIDLRETVYDFPRQNVITKDNVSVQINAILYFQIMDPVKAIYEIENLPDAIEKLTQTTLRNVIGELELDESLSSRDTINTKLRTILDEATNKWGVKINRVELQDINPPEDIKEAMEKQMRAERDRRAAVLEAEGQKRAKILEAEGFRESEIKKAEGEKQSEILKAEGQAQARIKTAEAEAKAIKLVSEAIEEKSGNPINYLIATKYIETLQEMVTGKDNKTVYIPFEATGVLGSLGGIKEMFKQ
ncbi:SPFH/Band 7/PHB domain protein [Candidatus Sulfidibacterium hydrothermale]|uniref:SPFH domain-containing protein n=1 Tax=Candidatus Sulfidibacterium hydrothermale TaxID=2875962 RepID=UPI001F0A4E94|nr:SPFH domain-containing protein [Candidatus Sulfidibacterium hydrothermale]UBM61938.1 SPFH/Band 7/PHB domain protein [Candidatus Sulfidibacterium hydrothermale]